MDRKHENEPIYKKYHKLLDLFLIQNKSKFFAINRLNIIFSLMLFQSILPFQLRAEPNLIEITKRIRPAVATVLSYSEDYNLLSLGTGFFIDSKGIFITNNHVVDGAFSAELLLSDGRKYTVKSVLAKDKDSDLIILTPNLDNSTVYSVRLSKTIPEIAEKILVIGSPKGLEQTVTEGIVSAIRDFPGIGNVYQISAPISSGSSGSPVINMKGEIIGVATFQFKDAQNLNFAVPIQKVSNLLNHQSEISFKKYAINTRSDKVTAILDNIDIGMDYNKVCYILSNITGQNCSPGYQNIEALNNECHWDRIGFSFISSTNTKSPILNMIFFVDGVLRDGTNFKREATMLKGWVDNNTYSDIRNRKNYINKNGVMYKYIWGE